MQDDANACVGDLPGGFRAGEAAANYVDGISLGSAGNHARRVSAFSRQAHLPKPTYQRVFERCNGAGPCVKFASKRDWRGLQKRQRPQRGGRYPFNRRLIRDQPL
jgi:hypothetical protein